MTVKSFIPTIWNASMLEQLRQMTVAGAIANRSYEGDARRGNTVRINTAIDVTMKDYKTAGRVTTPDTVESDPQDLMIDQEWNFDFLIDDIDRAQAAGTMDVFTRSASAAMAEQADKHLFSTMATAPKISNVSVAKPTDGNAAFDVIRDIGKALNKKLVPKMQRYLFCNAEFEALLVGADSKLTFVDHSGSPAGLRDASLGRLLGFNVISTENVPAGAAPTDPVVIGLWAPAFAYVSQLEKTEAMRADNSFSDRLRGLHVYGAKVIRPEGVAVAKFTG